MKILNTIWQDIANLNKVGKIRKKLSKLLEGFTVLTWLAPFGPFLNKIWQLLLSKCLVTLLASEFALLMRERAVVASLH